MRMSNIILIAIAIIVVVAISGYVLSSMKEEDSIARNNQKVLMDLKAKHTELSAKYAALQAQVNAQNTSNYDFKKDTQETLARTAKKLNELEYHAMKPRAVNVTLMKPIELKTPEALKVLSGVRVKKVASITTRKKATKKKATKKPSKKTIRKVKKQLRELSH